MSQTTPHSAAPHPAARDHRRKRPDASVGELMGLITADLSLLLRQEVALAKTELREEATKAGKGAGLLGAAGYAGHLTLLFGTFALVFAIGAVTGIAWACVIVTALWAAASAGFALTGKRALSDVHGTPRLTLATLKEDGQWLRHPRH